MHVGALYCPPRPTRTLTLALTMSPTALDYTPIAAPASKGDALVIGSLATAADGSYQELINSLSGRNVERQLVDRILDQGVF